ncbi:hypothetical protein RB599_002479 [Gaeumannomyces hyphopodioides]
MPSFSLLRRSPKDRAPADQQAQQATRGGGGGGSGGVGGGWVASWTRQADQDGGDRANPNNGGGGKADGSGNGSNSNGANGSDSNGRRGSSSKRELLHGLISRSMRGRGRLLVSASSSSSAGASNPPAAGPVAAAPAPPGAVEPAGHRPPPKAGETVVGLVLASPTSSSITTTTATATSTSSPPFSPRSACNPNKPLPSPPPPGSEEAAKTPPKKPTLKLARIMSTLTDSELEKLFSGAPQYFARSEGPNTGAPNPSVAFPWDESLVIRDLTDHTQIEDEAWGCTTALPHIIRSPRRPGSSGSSGSSCKAKRAHFYPKCHERPNMLSMHGLEKGTVGFSAAMELAASDALQEEQFGFDPSGHRANAIIEARQRMLTSKDGLRHMEESAIMEQLIKNGHRYVVNNIQDNTLSTALYNELFLHILHPPTRVLDHSDPYSLSVQIHALLKVLGTPNVWIDFSHVEWRIRLGQILWGSSTDSSEPEDDVEDISPDTRAAPTNVEARSEERYWLLLQILLACELWIRLDAIVEADDAGVGHIKPREIYRFQQEATPSVKWSMLMARAWLENIEIIKAEPPKLGVDLDGHQPTGWLATLTKRMSLTSDHHSGGAGGSTQGSRPTSSRLADDQPAYLMKGKHGQRQVDGLTHFARRLKWPDIESYENRISTNIRAVANGTTPLNSPPASPLPTTEARRSSYFGGTSGIFSKHLGSAHVSTTNGDAGSATKVAHIADQIRRQPSKRRKISAALHPSGWLSKSYVSGFMLPGEGLSHFIMSTLLENDAEAMRRLGPVANLCGGFVYCQKSFWSTACIVGRVVAAGKGAVECMGWISSDVTPQGLGDGWLNIEVAEPQGESARTGKQARIWGKLAVEKQSSVLGDADPDSVFPADFIIPFENIYKASQPPSLYIELKALKLFAPVDSVHTTPTGSLPQSPISDGTPATMDTAATSAAPEIHTYPAAVTFSVAEDYDDGDVDAEKEYTFCLSHDVYFVTAHPCVPSQHVRILKSPSSPTIQQIDLDSGSTSSGSSMSGFGSKPSSSANITCHPLHKYYTYTAIHLSELLARRDSTLEELLNEPGANAHRRPSITPGPHANKPPRVLVVDCITGFLPQPQAHEIPLSPIVSRTSSMNINWPQPQQQSQVSPPSSPPRAGEYAAGASSNGTDEPSSPSTAQKMHSESRRRQFGSDMEILIRAICAEKGWDALISRRRRGCLSCAIREAGALGWKVIIRVD